MALKNLLQSPCCRIPVPDGFIIRSRYKPLAIGRKRNGIDLSTVTYWRFLQTVCPYIPESNAPFLRSRCKPVPVGRECYGIDAAIVAPSVSRAPVATLHSLIVRFADGNARYGLLGENATALALPSASLQSFCLCIPDSDGPIIGRRYKTLTTGREFRRANPVIMTCKHLLQSSCPYVPNSNNVLNKRDASQMILGENAKARTL